MEFINWIIAVGFLAEIKNEKVKLSTHDVEKTNEEAFDRLVQFGVMGGV